MRSLILVFQLLLQRFNSETRVFNVATASASSQYELVASSQRTKKKKKPEITLYKPPYARKASTDEEVATQEIKTPKTIIKINLDDNYSKPEICNAAATPLLDTWSFWYHANNRAKSWRENLCFTTNVKYLEDFSSVYSHIVPVSKMRPGSDYMLFKKGIEPMTEDINNLNGGKWSAYLSNRKCSVLLVEKLWFKLLNALILDKFTTETEYINGAFVKIRRKGYEFELWTKSASTALVQIKIGEKFREVLDLTSMLTSYYEHEIDYPDDDDNIK